MKKMSLILAAVVLVAAIGIGVLMGQKNTLATEKSALEATIETLTKEKEALASEKEASVAAVTTLEAERDKAMEELTEAKASLEEKTKELGDKAATKETLDQVTEELAAAKASLEQMTQEKAACEGEKAELQSQLDAKIVALDELTAAKAGLDKQVEELTNLIKAAEEGQTEHTKELQAQLESKDSQLAAMQTEKQELTKQVEELTQKLSEAQASAQADIPIVVSKDGFSGPVTVAVTFEKDGVTIKTLTIGDENFAETPGFGEAAKEPEYAEQFIGKKTPLKLDDIDAISGATITTEAVLDAINEAAQQVQAN